MTAKAVSPLNLDRYELKYRIPISLIDPITDYVNNYCEMDYYSQISPGGFYIINSLYLDSMNMMMMRRPLGPEFAYSSFRIRSYGAGLTRDRGTDPPIALVGSADLRYAF